MLTRTPIGAAFAALQVCVCGCAGYPVPNSHLANAYATIRAAQEVGATTSPQAALHLKLAQEEHAKASALINDDKNEEADLMAMRASADAEVALAMARQVEAEGRAATAAAELRTLGQTNTAVASVPPVSATTTTTTTSATIPTTTGPSK